MKSKGNPFIQGGNGSHMHLEERKREGEEEEEGCRNEGLVKATAEERDDGSGSRENFRLHLSKPFSFPSFSFLFLCLGLRFFLYYLFLVCFFSLIRLWLSLVRNNETEEQRPKGGPTVMKSQRGQIYGSRVPRENYITKFYFLFLFFWEFFDSTAKKSD